MRISLWIFVFFISAYAGTLHRERRDHQPHEWMTPEQKAVLKELKLQGTLDEIKEKIMEYYKALPEEERKELDKKYKDECASWVKKVATQEEMTELKALHDAGNHDDLIKKVEEYKTRLDAETRKMVDVWANECKELWQPKTASRKRKSINALIDKHLSWLSEAQKQELRDMKTVGKSNDEIKAKVMAFYQSLDGEAKENTKAKLKEGCYAWLNRAASKEEVAALHKMHETDHAKCKKTVREYIKRLPASEQEEVNKNLPFCEKIWYGDHDHSSHAHHHKVRRALHSAVRHRRHEDHNLENSLKEHLDWLTEDQKTQLRAVENDKAAIHKKIAEFFEAASADVKPVAIEKIRGACKHLLKDAIGDEKFAELTKLKESGAAPAQIGAKAKEFFSAASDSPAKKRMGEAEEGCTKAYLWKPQ